jgi:hypothetical protein
LATWRPPAPAAAQPGDLLAGEVDPQCGQLGHHGAVATGGVGLLLERAELAADLTQEVLERGQVALGGGEPALGLLLAAAVLQDAGGLLDDQAAVLGRALSTASIWPWLMITCCWRPTPESLSSSWMSSSRQGRR